VTMLEAFAAIGAKPDMSEAEIRTCYRDRLRIAHPDRGGTAEHLARVLEAWRVVQSGENERRRCPICSGRRYIDVRAGFQTLRVTCGKCRGTGKKA